MDEYGHSSFRLPRRTVKSVKSAEAQRGFAAFPLFHLLGVEELRGRRAVTEGHLDVNWHLRQKPICQGHGEKHREIHIFPSVEMIEMNIMYF
jgi:hypothetical protein